MDIFIDHPALEEFIAAQQRQELNDLIKTYLRNGQDYAFYNRAIHPANLTMLKGMGVDVYYRDDYKSNIISLVEYDQIKHVVEDGNYVLA